MYIVDISGFHIMRSNISQIMERRTRALNPSYTKASVLGLNATILESPKMLVELFAEEVPSYIAQGIKHKSVSPFQCQELPRGLSFAFIVHCQLIIMSPALCIRQHGSRGREIPHLGRHSKQKL